jgi:hypothetical protein
MNRTTILLLFLWASGGNAHGESLLLENNGHSLFNGTDLTGWSGDPEIWSVEDGSITGSTNSKARLKHNTFLVWEGGMVKDFVLELEYRIDAGNSGIQYRSHLDDPKRWIVGGYQADLEAGDKYSGILYEERGRGILALRGQWVDIDGAGKRRVATVAETADLQQTIKKTRWNTYKIEAIGPHLRHTINGQVMSEVIDREEGKFRQSGILALQVHVGPPMKVQFRNLLLRRIKVESSP